MNIIEILEENNNDLKIFIENLEKNEEDKPKNKVRFDITPLGSSRTMNLDKIGKMRKPSALYLISFGTIKHFATFKEFKNIEKDCLAIKGNSIVSLGSKLRVFDINSGSTVLILSEFSSFVCVAVHQQWVIASTKNFSIKIFNFLTGDYIQKFIYFLFIFYLFFYLI